MARPGSRRILCVVLLHALMLLAPLPAAAVDCYPLDQVVLRLGPLGNITLINSVWGTSILDSIEGRDIYLLELSDPALQDSMIAALDSTLDAIYCDYNFCARTPEARRQTVVLPIGGTEDDVINQPAMERARTEEAHAISEGSGAFVGLIDTGFDLSHDYLADKWAVTLGGDFVDDDGDPSEELNGIDDDDDGQIDDGKGHGTMVAGILATVAPGATLVPMRVLDDEGRGYVFDVTEGLFRAIDMGIDVVNLSLGLENRSKAIDDALVEAREAGIPVVAAAGNDSAGTALYPARDAKALGVTATDSADVKTPFANWSPHLDLSAPGADIMSAYMNDGFAIGSGTSFSAPFLAGTLALLYERYAGTLADSLTAWTQRGSVFIDTIPENEEWAGALGAGRVDCYGALVSAPPATAVEPGDHRAAAAVGAITLYSSAPNPTSGEAVLRFALARGGAVRLDIYAVDGRLVRSETLGRLPAGEHRVSLPGRDVAGSPLPSGRYLYRLVAADAAASGRLTLVR